MAPNGREITMFQRDAHILHVLGIYGDKQDPGKRPGSGWNVGLIHLKDKCQGRPGTPLP